LGKIFVHPPAVRKNFLGTNTRELESTTKKQTVKGGEPKKEKDLICRGVVQGDISEEKKKGVVTRGGKPEEVPHHI